MTKAPITPTTAREIDNAIEHVGSNAQSFSLLSAQEKSYLLRMCMQRLVEIAPKWVQTACAAKHISFDTPRAAEEWLAGPVVTVRQARLLSESLEEIGRIGTPKCGTDWRLLSNGKLEVDVFPTGTYDKLALGGFKAAVRFPTGVRKHDVLASQASNHRLNPQRRRQQVCAVLGAGNVSAIPPTDVFSKMFTEGYVCVLKMNPVNEWLGLILEKALKPLIQRDFLAIVYGGAEQGKYLCQHPGISAIHVTGSRATHDDIVWGPSRSNDQALERMRRISENRSRIGNKQITSELGNVSPVLIVPGTYSEAEFKSMVWNVASMKVNNASCNCNSAQVVVTSESWSQRERFVKMLGDALDDIAPRYDYYPGARDRFHDLLSRAALQSEVTCCSVDTPLQFALVSGINCADDNPLFSEEAFCPIMGETALPSRDAEDFLRQVTTFANERLVGTLNATLIVPPSALRDPVVARMVEAAIDMLRYGTVAVNHWPGVSFGLGSTPWGGAPGGTLADPESGIGWVHNSYMLEGMEKVVLRGPLVPSPKPPWFANNSNAHNVAERLLHFEESPSALRFPGLAAAALRG